MSIPKLLLLALGCSAFAGWCEAKAPQLTLRYERFMLDNGLTVIVNEDRSVPLVSIHVAYRVGSRNEPAGRTGFAHLFEHLMFKGSQHSDADWFTTLQEMGAISINGETHRDRTFYSQTVPTQALDRMLWLESDRMGYLLGAVTQAKLDAQRGVVQNEKRQGENKPYGRLSHRLNEALFPPGHPYHHATIGSMADLDAASLDQVHQWFRDYYGPNNAILVLSGDIDAAGAREKAERYFGAIAPGRPLDAWTRWVPTRLHNTHDVQYDAVAAARVQRAWAVPGRPSRDEALLALAGAILGGGRNGWLNAELIEERQLATSAFAGVDSRALAGVFSITVDLKPGVNPRIATEALERAGARLMTRGPTASELRSAVSALTLKTMMLLRNASGRAEALALGEQQAGDPAFLNQYLAWIDAATVEDVRGAARRHLASGWHQIDVLPRIDLKAAAVDADRAVMPLISDVPVAINFPQARTATLPNGLRLVVAEVGNASLVSFALQFDAGYAADRPDRIGASSLAMNLLDEGTRSRDARAIASQAAQLGALISFFTTNDASGSYLQALPNHLPRSIALWADLIRNPTFHAADLERLRAERLAWIQGAKNDPMMLISYLMRRAVFGPGHGYSVPTSGLTDEAMTRAISREDVLAFRQNWLRPDNATLFVVGNITLEQVRPLLEDAFQDWRAPGAPVPKKNIAAVERRNTPRIILVDRPGAPQSVIMGGDAGPGAASPDQLAAIAANSVLGGGFTSRINTNLREQKNWSYAAGSNIAEGRDQSLFYVYALVRTDKTGESLSELVRELRALNGERPITAKEHAAFVASALKQLPISYETALDVMSSLMTSVLNGSPLDDPRKLSQRYRELTLDEAHAAARGLVHPQGMTWIVIGDRTKIESQIDTLNIAPVEHWSGGSEQETHKAESGGI